MPNKKASQALHLRFRRKLKSNRRKFPIINKSLFPIPQPPVSGPTGNFNLYYPSPFFNLAIAREDNGGLFCDNKGGKLGGGGHRPTPPNQDKVREAEALSANERDTVSRGIGRSMLTFIKKLGYSDPSGGQM